MMFSGHVRHVLLSRDMLQNSCRVFFSESLHGTVCMEAKLVLLHSQLSRVLCLYRSVSRQRSIGSLGSWKYSRLLDGLLQDFGGWRLNAE